MRSIRLSLLVYFLLLLSVIIVLTHGTALAPFIYSVF